MAQANRLKLPSASARQQAENKLIWNEERNPRSALFYTIGYTGRRLDEILDLLIAHEVRTLVDIRQYPISMYRPEMSKGNLRQAVEERGLIYAHFPQLGVPRDIRAKAIETGTRDIIWEWYDQHIVAPYIRRNLHRFFNTLEHRVALMCVEVDPHECHRHRLSLALEARGLTSFDL
ncbi:MAG: DUF488 domain-containing protein [Pyrinomonadaceae bacterium]|nr:DUF488 domain-containing protein [Pyrinomonadaceae bacterium]